MVVETYQRDAGVDFLVDFRGVVRGVVIVSALSSPINDEKDNKKGHSLAERPWSRAEIQRTDSMDNAPHGVRMAISIIMLLC